MSRDYKQGTEALRAFLEKYDISKTELERKLDWGISLTGMRIRGYSSLRTEDSWKIFDAVKQIIAERQLLIEGLRLEYTQLFPNPNENTDRI